MTVRPQSAQRMTSLMLVMLMHGLLLMLLLHAFSQKSGRSDAARETILRLLPILQRVPQDDAAPSSGAATNARPVAAPVVPPATASQPAAPDVTGLGMQLFGCAPEQLAALSLAERARCATGLAHPDRSVVTIPKSHVQDPVRRAAEMKAKNAPVRVPCTYVGIAPGPYYSSTPSGMIDPFCTIDGLLSGFPSLTGAPK